MIQGTETLQEVLGRNFPSGLAWALFLALWMSVPHRAAADSPTSGTLRLSDVFLSGPGSPGFVEGTARHNPRGAALLIPDTGAWRVPPAAPVEEKTEPDFSVFAELPPISMPDLRIRQEQVRLLAEPFLDRGRLFAPIGGGLALLEVETGFTFLRSQYRLTPMKEGRPAGDPIDFFHGPSTREEFALPAGEYALERRLWRLDSPEKPKVMLYRTQTLQPGSRYQFSTEREQEAELMLELREMK